MEIASSDVVLVLWNTVFASKCWLLGILLHVHPKNTMAVNTFTSRLHAVLAFQRISSNVLGCSSLQVDTRHVAISITTDPPQSFRVYGH